VDDQPGITRDRLYASVEWQGKSFALVDTAALMIQKRSLCFQG